MSTVNWSRIGAEEVKPSPRHGGMLLYRCRCGYQCASKDGAPECIYCNAAMEAVG